MEKKVPTPIKNLVVSADKKHNVIYKKETLVTDQNTGEIMQSVQETIAREPNKERFLKVFVSNIVAYQNMSEAENTLFYQIIKNHMNYGNIVYFTNVIRSTIISNKLMSRSTFYRAKEGLVNKKILLPLDKEKQLELQKDEDMPIFAEEAYLVNPNIIGQGSFRDLKRLRQIVETDFNFETGEAVRSIQTETAYVGLDEVKESPESFEIKSVSHENDNNKNIKTEVLVGDKKSEPKSSKNDVEEIVEAEICENEQSVFDDFLENNKSSQSKNLDEKDDKKNGENENKVQSEKELLEIQERVTLAEKEKIALEIERQKNEMKLALIKAGKIDEAFKL